MGADTKPIIVAITHICHENSFNYLIKIYSTKCRKTYLPESVAACVGPLSASITVSRVPNYVSLQILNVYHELSITPGQFDWFFLASPIYYLPPRNISMTNLIARYAKTLFFCYLKCVFASIRCLSCPILTMHLSAMAASLTKIVRLMGAVCMRVVVLMLDGHRVTWRWQVRHIHTQQPFHNVEVPAHKHMHADG